jgi:hypothetical protein
VNADVDESLFGNTGVPRAFLASKEHDKAQGTKPARGSGREGRKQQAPSQAQYGRRASPAPKAEAIVMSAYDLQGIKARAVIYTDEDRAAEAAESAYQHEQKHAIAQKRKDKMLRMEAERRAKTGPSEEMQEKINQQMAARTNAAQMMDEQADDVKRMNQMSNYAKTVTIRDRQIADKVRASLLFTAPVMSRQPAHRWRVLYRMASAYMRPPSRSPTTTSCFRSAVAT